MLDVLCRRRRLSSSSSSPRIPRTGTVEDHEELRPRRAETLLTAYSVEAHRHTPIEKASIAVGDLLLSPSDFAISGLRWNLDPAEIPFLIARAGSAGRRLGMAAARDTHKFLGVA